MGAFDAPEQPRVPSKKQINRLKGFDVKVINLKYLHYLRTKCNG